jgi:RHS repeat-associated protein
VVGENVYFKKKLLVSNGVYVVTDRLGTVRGNTQGEPFFYYPYGEERSSTADGRDKFATYFRDTVGQDYAEQRYYNSNTGSFWSPDPTMNNVDYGNPGTWNPYAYVNGDPINHNDPTGLQALPVTSGGDPNSCLNQALIPWMNQNDYTLTANFYDFIDTTVGTLGMTLYFEDTTGSTTLYTDLAQVMINRYRLQKSNLSLAQRLGLPTGTFTSIVQASSTVWTDGQLTDSEVNTLVNVLDGSVVGRQSAVNASACDQLISALNVALTAQGDLATARVMPGATVGAAAYWFYTPPAPDPVNHNNWSTTPSRQGSFIFETLRPQPRQPPAKPPGRGRLP